MVTISNIILIIWLLVTFLVALFLWVGDRYTRGPLGLFLFWVGVMVLSIIIGLVALIVLALVALLALLMAFPVVHFFITYILF